MLAVKLKINNAGIVTGSIRNQTYSLQFGLPFRAVNKWFGYVHTHRANTKFGSNIRGQLLNDTKRVKRLTTLFCCWILGFSKDGQTFKNFLPS